MTNQQVVQIPPAIVVGDLAELLGVSGIDVIKELMKNGVMATITQVVDFDTAAVVAADLGFAPEEQGAEAEEAEETAEAEAAAPRTLRIVEEGEGQVTRPPVVTVLGHVDHGKTTLLDRIRETNVVAGEAGGITQHIGAYQAKAPDGRPITFIDTPGHEAFSKMRARGAMVTDVAIIVVAADDGVMPQTREAIDHVRAAGVPMVIAINKIDAGNANPDRVKQQLTEVGLVPEEYGGDQLVVPISALKGEGIAELLENVQLLTDLADLTANPNQNAVGVVLEAQTDRHRGVVATVLVQTGTLHQGDTLLAGLSYGRVKAMTLATGERVSEAGPSTPVEILGLSEVPPAGERFVVRKNEKEARAEADERRRALEAGAMDKAGVTLDTLFGEIHQGNVKDFNLVLKTDVQGSIDPLVQSLEDLSVEEVNVKVIHASVGSVTESDVQLAVASSGVIIAFNVPTEPGAERLAKQEKVEIREYQIIYTILEDVEKAVKGMLAPVYREVQDATIEVRQIFRLGRRNAIAGCYVREGTAVRNSQCRVMRGNDVIHEGRIDSLKRIDEDAREVAAGLECGIMVTNFTDFEEGDNIVTFHQEQVR
ncbi:MAG: translation initiation factor IF-2 [Myxococcales bacterium]|nr:translation initiation factor IF-2 [Dehalococcoidia bacterium]MCB9483893.1 translation initiation factor IF-2 [Dehalococcoidia bacterium]MCB9534612.1 translation initiation factor IF-2 [Myxococcales bacterium]